ncbi:MULTISPECIES: hypothetical protein [Cellulomonas]|uniref:Histidine kinase n=1 Tax=Cellulomonas iranensis TaxID=76862 RepID=A0ABU0GPE8_9CELL|nr:MULTISPECIES: hypothetical protein [Cellulomonas]MDQ0426475.1 hypothetical protein [Cellulomonas iranensis]TFH74136.1 hypothetical protein E4A51_01360 [Cellulomonas sp. HD19AZ1]
MPTPPSSHPPLLVVACGLVLLEALALGAAAVVGVVSLGGGGDVGPVLFLVLLALGAAALLVGAVRGLWGGRRWPRGPVLTVQLFVVVAATTWWRAGGGALALVPVVVAVVVGAALLVPSVVAATSSTGRRTD